jgi:hypothetical protein
MCGGWLARMQGTGALHTLIIDNVNCLLVREKRYLPLASGGKKMRSSAKIMVLAFLVLLASVGVASADPGENIKVGYTSNERSIVPVLIEGNPMTCRDMGCGEGTFFKIEQPAGVSYSGTYDLGSGRTITITTTDEQTIAWTSNVDINCVFMKGGPGGDSYCYGPGVRSDSGLSTPLGTNNNQPKGISHINICYTSSTNVPEFPVGIIPVFIIGLLGLVFFIREYH